MLWAQAGVGSRDEVFHPQAVHPFAGKFRFTEREPDTQEKETASNHAAGFQPTCLTMIMTNSLMEVDDNK